jgi:5-formyltetrahydrofolate cyclo-ligase
MDIKELKKALRKEQMEKRNLLSVEGKALHDAKINKALLALVEEKKCKVVHAYIPMGSEIDIRPLIEELLANQITVVSPKTLPKRKLENRVLVSLAELETGIMGTQHPLEATIYEGPFDLIIVPGLAFDSDNYRLGYGGGYYDNFIVNYPGAFKVGIFYPEQYIEKVPIEPHDMQLDLIFQ